MFIETVIPVLFISAYLWVFYQLAMSWVRVGIIGRFTSRIIGRNEQAAIRNFDNGANDCYWALRDAVENNDVPDLSGPNIYGVKF